MLSRTNIAQLQIINCLVGKRLNFGELIPLRYSQVSISKPMHGHHYTDLTFVCSSVTV